jgi:hypothetical protein
MSEKKRRSIKQTTAFRRVKLFLKRMVGREIWLRPDIHVNTAKYGDWTVCPDLLTIRRNMAIGQFVPIC